MKKNNNNLVLKLLFLFTAFNFLNSSFSQGFKTVKFTDSIPELELAINKVADNRLITFQKYPGNQRKLLIKFVEDHRKASLSKIKKGEIINSGILYEYVDSIFQIILEANPKYAANQKVYLVRNFECNAYNSGDGNVFIHLGLLSQINNESQLAMVLAHELSHDILKHMDWEFVWAAEFTTNQEIKQGTQEIRRTDIRQTSKLEALYRPFIYAKQASSRKFETDADNLGVELYKNTSFDQSKIPELFTVLEESDSTILWETVNLPKLIPDIGFDNELLERYNSFSSIGSLGVFEAEVDTISKFLASHPFPLERGESLIKTLGLTEKSKNRTFSNRFDKLTFEIYSDLVINCIIDNRLDAAMFYCLGMQERLGKTEFVNTYMHYCLSLLSAMKVNKKEGYFLDILERSSDLQFNQFTRFFFGLNPTYCEDFLKNYPLPTLDDKAFLDLEKSISIYSDFSQKKYQLSYEKLNSNRYLLLNPIFDGPLRALVAGLDMKLNNNFERDIEKYLRLIKTEKQK